MFLDLFVNLYHNRDMDKNDVNKQGNLITLYNRTSEKDAFDKCVFHLLNLKNNLKDEDFSMQWIKDLLSWQLARNNVDNVCLFLSNKGIKPSYSEKIISLSTKELNKLDLRSFAQLTDTLIHEFNHFITDLNNQKIKKDEYGNVNAKYIRPFPYWNMVHFLDKHFKDKILLGDIINGMYYKNEYEKTARKVAYDESINLVESTIHSASFTQKFYLKKLLKMINKNKDYSYYSFAEDVSSYNNYQSLLEDISRKFQKDFTIEKDDDYLYLYVARYLYVSDELDQANFKKLVAQNQVNSAVSLIDEFDFRNNEGNIIELDKLLKQNNRNIQDTQFKTLDKKCILKVINKYNRSEDYQNTDNKDRQEIFDKFNQKEDNNAKYSSKNTPPEQ